MTRLFENIFREIEGFINVTRLFEDMFETLNKYLPNLSKD
jgi:hypothetical protein